MLSQEFNCRKSFENLTKLWMQASVFTFHHLWIQVPCSDAATPLRTKTTDVTSKLAQLGHSAHHKHIFSKRDLMSTLSFVCSRAAPHDFANCGLHSSVRADSPILRRYSIVIYTTNTDKKRNNISIKSLSFFVFVFEASHFPNALVFSLFAWGREREVLLC